MIGRVLRWLWQPVEMPRAAFWSALGLGVFFMIALVEYAVHPIVCVPK